MEQWFDPRTAGILGGILGTVLGLTCALMGCFWGIFVRKGWKKPLYTMFILGITVSTALLITGIVAVCVKQPRHVWLSFLLPGVVVNIVFLANFPFVRRKFIESEMMKMQAKDI